MGPSGPSGAGSRPCVPTGRPHAGAALGALTQAVAGVSLEEGSQQTLGLRAEELGHAQLGPAKQVTLSRAARPDSSLWRHQRGSSAPGGRTAGLRAFRALREDPREPLLTGVVGGMSPTSEIITFHTSNSIIHFTTNKASKPRQSGAPASSGGAGEGGAPFLAPVLTAAGLRSGAGGSGPGTTL